MRYLAMIIMFVMIILGLFIIINLINDKLLDNWITEEGIGYFTGSIGMVFHNEVLLKWYKKEW